MSWFYGRDGQRITFEEWGPLFDNIDARIIGKDRVGESMVSTVWLGIDHQFVQGGPPLIFETMIFDGPFAERMWRYTTEEEAKAGHDRVVAALRNGESP